MGVVFRQSVKTTAITFAGAALGAIIVLVASNMMPKQELGFSRNLTSQTVVANVGIQALAVPIFTEAHRLISLQSDPAISNRENSAG